MIGVRLWFCCCSDLPMCCQVRTERRMTNSCLYRRLCPRPVSCLWDSHQLDKGQWFLWFVGVLFTDMYILPVTKSNALCLVIHVCAKIESIKKVLLQHVSSNWSVISCGSEKSCVNNNEATAFVNSLYCSSQHTQDIACWSYSLQSMCDSLSRWQSHHIILCARMRGF